ncbi:LuxR family two component transcriptional regulator [Paraburkholderia sp. BL6665CI2N2]|uniref:response regulator transcription factor n=1 Tax=unclassified Paraburkholderia TaxID=2615204 RepID=UPI000D04C5EF|nr:MULTISPECIES: response regulator transcription factor [unclassified Paraburkholderia]PRY05487.1 LuxR family two component transcriptional regulator [Paraburkholderia sp. BL25I1N1]TDY25196.1 LuxR family two component transcriptional regulator [Paraburkholderia sp. BL6665CI2N2]
MRQKIRVIIADDHDCVRVGVKRVLQAAPNIECVGEAADTHELAELLDACSCDVVVSDISMPGIHGGSNAVSFLRRLLRGQSHPCVVVLTMICHAHMLSGLLHIGVSGIVDKRETVTALIDAIEAAFAGHIYLSEHARVAIDAADAPPQLRAGMLSAREWEVFQLYVQGLAVHEIAVRLQRSGKTISTQKRSAMRKLGLETEADLIDYARQIGLT